MVTISIVNRGLSMSWRVSSDVSIPPALACPCRNLSLSEYPTISIPLWLRFLKFTGHGNGGNFNDEASSTQQPFMCHSDHFLGTTTILRNLVYA